jgi:Flp pilus assembly protein TadD
VSAIQYRPVILAVSLVALASAGCSKAGPTKDELLARAKDAFAAEQYDKAEKEYREVLGVAFDDPVAVRQLGIIYHNQGQLPQAYPLLKKAAELSPEDPEVQLDFGLSNLTLGAFQQARDAALTILDKEPGNEQAVLLLANAAVTAADIVETRKRIEDYRRRDQDRPGFHLAFGTLDLRRKDEARAESEFKAALDLDPNSSAALKALGILYQGRNDLKAADEAFKKAANLSSLRVPQQHLPTQSAGPLSAGDRVSRIHEGRQSQQRSQCDGGRREPIDRIRRARPLF